MKSTSTNETLVVVEGSMLMQVDYVMDLMLYANYSLFFCTCCRDVQSPDYDSQGWPPADGGIV